MIEATADTVPASQLPARQGAQDADPQHPPDQQEQSVANKWFTTFQKKIEKTVRYAAGFAPAKTTSTAGGVDGRGRPRPRRADAASGSRTGSGRRPARRSPAGRMRWEQRLGQRRASGGDVAVVDGQKITVADLQATMNIARLTLKTSYPEPGTTGTGSRCARARSSRLLTMPSCAPGRTTSE